MKIKYWRRPVFLNKLHQFSTKLCISIPEFLVTVSNVIKNTVYGESISLKYLPRLRFVLILRFHF